jgi:hypothetical protein
MTQESALHPLIWCTCVSPTNLKLPVASVLARLSEEATQNQLCTSPTVGLTLVNIWPAVLLVLVAIWVGLCIPLHMHY